MANTYTQMNVQAVFAVKGRENIITKDFRDELYKYVYGILSNIGQYSLAVNGWKDHIHIFFEMQPVSNLSNIIQIVKSNSSKWINIKKFVHGKFSWQEGYGGFTYSRSQRNQVINYIMNQEKHHSKCTFREEYLDLLKKFEIKYDEKYLFEFYD
ncbi:MAG: IS200/IS605 family transposase [Cytophagales bacterium]|nr:IS200/IS605 family transposase [Cytophagales bacterium]